jgi:hypothetical protein
LTLNEQQEITKNYLKYLLLIKTDESRPRLAAAQKKLAEVLL